MPNLRPITSSDFMELAQRVDAYVPIEQDPIWDEYESRVQGVNRASMYLAWEDSTNVRALISLRDYPLRSHCILWARSGPIWLDAYSKDDEADLVSAISRYAKEHSDAIAVRMHTEFAHEGAAPTFHPVAYDKTVFVDLDKPEDQVLADMRKRGRRDVRRAMRAGLDVTEVPANQVVGRLDALYEIMWETAERDSFVAQPRERMQAFLETLVPAGKARLFEVSRDGNLMSWAIVVVTGRVAQYYFGASNSQDREGAADLALWEAMKAVRKDGVKVFDMMGIGSDLAPALSSLNTFKTKFATEVSSVAPARDYPLGPTYRLLVLERRALRSLRRVASSPRKRHAHAE